MNQNESAARATENLSPARATLQRLKAEVFGGSDDELALALGRPTEEIETWLAGGEEIDEDAEMKINGIAKERLPE